MVKLKRWLFVFAAFIIILAVIGLLSDKDNSLEDIADDSTANESSPLPINPARSSYKLDKSIIGTHFSPENMPYSFYGDDNAQGYFELNKKIGSHVALNLEWKAEEFYTRAEQIIQSAKKEGFITHLYLSPLTLEEGRNRLEAPSSVSGTSFKESAVREAYKEKALQLASLKPDYFGLATEANYLSSNPEEFDAFISLTQETYAEIKQKYPEQKVTISFQWDELYIKHNYDSVKAFSNSLDVYSFTSYPSAYRSRNPQELPKDYYSLIKEEFPDEKIGFSELGWFSGEESSEERQAEFFYMLPTLIEGAEPEYVNMILMYDIPSKYVSDERLNSLGIRREDGTPKKSWETIVNY